MQPNDFVRDAEIELRNVAQTNPDNYAVTRDAIIGRARSEFDSSLVKEIADALPDDPDQCKTLPPPGIQIPGFRMPFG